jgi:hypothetical protein
VCLKTGDRYIRKRKGINTVISVNVQCIKLALEHGVRELVPLKRSVEHFKFSISMSFVDVEISWEKHDTSYFYYLLLSEDCNLGLSFRFLSNLRR